MPPAFRDYPEFATYVGALERARLLDDYTQIWWDLRPHPQLGTIEVRAMDAVERLDDAVALAAYVQALVKRAVEAPAPPSPTALEDAIVRENKWQAIRHGLDATVIAADGRSMPIRTHILRTLDELAEAAAELGSEAGLRGIERIVREPAPAPTGSSRRSPRRGDLRIVARSIADETARVYTEM